MDLHDELGRFGEQNSADAARRLRDDSSREAILASVTTGRRRRRIGATTVAAVAVGAVAIGAWAAAPALRSLADGGVAPAGRPGIVRAGPYEYAVSADSPERPPQVVLDGAAAVTCGDTVDLTPGVTVHDPGALTGSIALGAQLGSSDDLSKLLTADQEAALNWDSSQSSWGVVMIGDELSYEATALLLDRDQVVGIAEPTVGYGRGMSRVTGGLAVPRIGQCEGPAPSGKAGDPLNTVIVAQYWANGASSPNEWQLLATIVVDPNQPAVVSSPEAEPSPTAEPTAAPSAGSSTAASASESLAEPLIALGGNTDTTALQCGDVWSLEPGESTHAAQPADVSGTLTTEFIDPEFQNPSGWKVTSGGPREAPDIGFLEGTFAVVDGKVVGVGVPNYWSLFAKQFVLDDTDQFNAVPSAECGELASLPAAGMYERHWVVQAVYTDGDSIVPLKTWIDPGGSMTLDAS